MMQIPPWLAGITGAGQFANNPENNFQPTFGDGLQGIGHSMLQHYRGQAGAPTAAMQPGATATPSGNPLMAMLAGTGATGAADPMQAPPPAAGLMPAQRPQAQQPFNSMAFQPRESIFARFLGPQG